MCHVHNEKRIKTNNRRNRTTESEKYQNDWKKGKLQVYINTGSRHHQTNSSRCNFKKKQISNSDEQENFSKPNSARGISSKE